MHTKTLTTIRVSPWINALILLIGTRTTNSTQHNTACPNVHECTYIARWRQWCSHKIQRHSEKIKTYTSIHEVIDLATVISSSRCLFTLADKRIMQLIYQLYIVIINHANQKNHIDLVRTTLLFKCKIQNIYLSSTKQWTLTLNSHSHHNQASRLTTRHQDNVSMAT